MVKALQIDRAVDGNLKPVKDSDGSLTALEVSTDKVRVKDLEIAGNISSPLKVDGNLTIDSGGDIALDAGGGDITFAAGGTSYLNWLATGTLQMLSVLDVDDYLSFDIASNGVSYISTNDDSGGNLANLILNVSGDIILNSKNGVFIQQNNGTEFSATNSAYAGMILGYTDIGLDESRTTYTLTTSFVVPTDEFSVSFKAPPSGNVEIMISVCFNAGSAGVGDLYAGLSTANATSGYAQLADFHEEELLDQSGRYGRDIVQNYWTLTGLTPGTAYEYWVGFKSTVAHASIVIEYGGSDSGHNPDFIMKATALPATITT